MGRLRTKTAIPLSLFFLRYFAYLFVLMLALALLLLLSFNSLLVRGLVYPADQAQTQAASAKTAIQEAAEVTPDLIPELCQYLVFDQDGKLTQGNASGQDVRSAWAAVQDNRKHVGTHYYTVIPRGAEYCVLQYQFYPQYTSPALRKVLPPPQTLLLLITAFCALLVITGTAVCFGRSLKRRLAPLTAVVNKIERQELDFEITASGIQEINAILHSMDNMRLALKTSLEQQWQAEQEKNEQMSALAHDLKTPLTVVRGNAELLLESALPEPQANYARYIERSSLQMQHYVQTLIEVTRSCSALRLQMRETDCAPLFAEIEQQARGLCAVKGLSLIWDCACAAVRISADQELLVRALTNVIANAVEHTPAGGTVSCLIRKESRVLSFTVLDTGRGFSPEALKHGTERFFMDDPSRHSKAHFGLGLYFALSVIQSHGGTLSLENASETGGARVVIRIPC